MSDKRRRRPNDPGAFPLPISGLFADLELGIGGIHLPDEFFEASSAIQLEVISDWQQALNELRLRSVVRLFRELSASLDGLSDEQKLERFRITCRSLDIECPEDMAALLRRY